MDPLWLPVPIYEMYYKPLLKWLSLCKILFHSAESCVSLLASGSYIWDVLQAITKVAFPV